MKKAEAARLTAYLSGRVQGVGMRYYVCSLAQVNRLRGFVRNLPDGRVEAVFEGPRSAVEKVLEDIKTGEYAGCIRDVASSWEAGGGGFSGFSIRL